MKPPAFRAIALIVLILSVLSWTGLASTVSALDRPAADPCCDRSADDESRDPFSCSPQECPCFSCLPFEPAEPAPFSSLTAAASVLLAAPPSSYPTGFVRAIDYPPEVS